MSKFFSPFILFVRDWMFRNPTNNSLSDVFLERIFSELVLSSVVSSLRVFFSVLIEGWTHVLGSTAPLSIWGRLAVECYSLWGMAWPVCLAVVWGSWSCVSNCGF